MLATACRYLATAALFMSLATPATAAWHRASSTHFIIYADENPAKLRAFAEKLERFDRAVRSVRGMKDYPVGDGNRLTVFVVRNDSAVQKLIQDKTGYVRGFYIPRASGSIAFVPRSSGSGSKWDLDAETVFFHEYAHHMMLQDNDLPLPAWLVEGFAEFMSTANVETDGSVGFGTVPMHRAHELFLGQQLPIETVLSGTVPRRSDPRHESLYGRGWLLTHYLTFEPSRSGQLDRYITGIANGVQPLELARTAFGDLKQLDREIDRYVRRPRLPYVKVSNARLNIGAIEVQPLSQGAEAVLPLRMRSKRGVNDRTAEPLAAEVRAVAARFPADPLVNVTLAEAELDARHYGAAQAAADRALSASPRNTEAMVLKGIALMERAVKSGSREAGPYNEARKLFVGANEIDTEDPEPLLNFYLSYLRQGIAPTSNAVEALHYASRLAPQDHAVRMNSAVQYLRDGKVKEARETLSPIAYSPHGGRIAGVAQMILASITANDSAGALRIAEQQPAGDEGDGE